MGEEKKNDFFSGWRKKKKSGGGGPCVSHLWATCASVCVWLCDALGYRHNTGNNNKKKKKKRAAKKTNIRRRRWKRREITVGVSYTDKFFFFIFLNQSEIGKWRDSTRYKTILTPPTIIIMIILYTCIIFPHYLFALCTFIISLSFKKNIRSLF